MIYTGQSGRFLIPDVVMGVQMGEDIQAGLTDRMIYHRHVDTFLIFPVSVVWFNLQDLHFFHTYSVALLIWMSG
jgi:hypothetical protein